MMSVAQSLGRALAQSHDRPIFGLAGSGNFSLLASFVDAGGRYIPAMHEAGAVGMAAGWSEMSGDVGIASVHQGPGVTNSLTALIDAAKGHTPLVLITAQLESSSHHQWIEQKHLLNSCGVDVKVTSLSGNSSAITQLHEALFDAALNRRPHLFQIPISLMNSPHTDTVNVTEQKMQSLVHHAPLQEDIESAAIMLYEARCPVIIAGRGAVVAGAGPALQGISAHIDAPLMTTAPAHGLFAQSAQAQGMIGGLASHETSRLLKQADVILAVGTSLDQWSTAGDRLIAPDAIIVRVDTADVTHRGNQTLIRADAREAAAKIKKELKKFPPTTSQRGEPQPINTFLHADNPSESPSETLVDPRQLLQALDEILPIQRIVCLDSGHFIAMASLYLRRLSGPHFLFGQDFQSVGLGIYHAIGAALARPDLQPVAVIGDGGAGMSLLELQTAIDLGIPLIVVVMNDASYGAEVHDFRPLGISVSIAQFPIRNWAKIAAAMGAQSATVTQLGDLDTLRQWLRNSEGPVLLDCHVDPSISAETFLTDEGRAEWAH